MGNPTSIKDALDKKREASILNSNSTVSTVTVGEKIRKMTPSSARSFVESLNPRVVPNKQFYPYYCNAVLKLGVHKVLFCEKMALEPNVKNAERMFSWLLKQELDALGGDITKASA